MTPASKRRWQVACLHAEAALYGAMAATLLVSWW